MFDAKTDRSFSCISSYEIGEQFGAREMDFGEGAVFLLLLPCLNPHQVPQVHRQYYDAKGIRVSQYGIFTFIPQDLRCTEGWCAWVNFLRLLYRLLWWRRFVRGVRSPELSMQIMRRDVTRVAFPRGAARSPGRGVLVPVPTHAGCEADARAIHLARYARPILLAWTVCVQKVVRFSIKVNASTAWGICVSGCHGTVGEMVVCPCRACAALSAAQTRHTE